MSVSTNASGKSSQRSDSGLMKYVTNFISHQAAKAKTIWRKFQETQEYFLVLPSVFTIIVSVLCAAAFNIAANVELTSLSYYNLLHIGLFFVTEYMIVAIIYAFHQQSRYITAWKLAFSKTTLGRVQKDSHGHVGSVKRWLTILLTIFQITSIIATFYAEWNPSISGLGTFPCVPAKYSPLQLEDYTASAPVISGDIDFALIYMYGLPLADGLIAGFAPWPIAAPLKQFHIEGKGPMVILQTICDSEVYDTNDTELNAPFDKGSGFKLENIRQGRTFFNIDYTIYLPGEAMHIHSEEAVEGEAVEHFAINSTWGSQYCTVHGILGVADWVFDYQVDKWNMVTAGQAVVIDVAGVSLNIQSGLNTYAGEFYNKILATGKMSNYSYDTSTEQSEGTILMDSIIRSILEVTNNTWQYPSQSALFSNLMSWGTEPDGLYHPEHTSRGLAGAFGAIFHQVFLQYDSALEDTCDYSGFAGSGKMDLFPVFVIMINVLLGLIIATMVVSLFSLYLTQPLRRNKHEVFEYGAKIMVHDYIRCSYLAKWFSESLEISKAYGSYAGYGTIKDVSIRVGALLSTLDQDKPVIWIGPIKQTASISRLQAHQSPDDADENMNLEQPILSQKVPIPDVIPELHVPRDNFGLNPLTSIGKMGNSRTHFSDDVQISVDFSHKIENSDNDLILGQNASYSPRHVSHENRFTNVDIASEISPEANVARRESFGANLNIPMIQLSEAVVLENEVGIDRTESIK